MVSFVRSVEPYLESSWESTVWVTARKILWLISYPLPGLGKCLSSSLLSADALSISIAIHHTSSKMRASFSHPCCKHITLYNSSYCLGRKLLSLRERKNCRRESTRRQRLQQPPAWAQRMAEVLKPGLLLWIRK